MERRSTPLPPNWRTEIRPFVLNRDDYRCTWIHGNPEGLPVTAAELDGPRRCNATATDADHIGDRDDHRPENLRSLCGPHHDHRTAGQAAAIYQARRRRPTEPHPGFIR